MPEKNQIRELLSDQHPDRKVSKIEAVQFQLAQKSDAVAGQSIANGLFVGNLSVVPVGSAFSGFLSLAINNTVAAQNIERVVKDGQQVVEMKGVAFDSLTPTYSGADAAGTKICSLIFTGHKVTFN